MNSDIAVLLNRIGLFLGFVSFWLAALEILGEEKLIEAENWFERVFRRIPSELAASLMWNEPFSWRFIFTYYLISLSIGFFFMLPFFIYAILARDPLVIQEIGFWMPFLAGVLINSILYGIIVFGSRLLDVLNDDTQIRRRALIVGSLLFAIGTLLQFIATF